MNFPLSTSSSAGLVVSAVLGVVFGILLHKGGVTNYNVIVNFFRLRDMRVLKVMFTAVVVGGIGVYLLISGGLAEGWHIKTNLLLGIILGAGIFGVGMVIYGYCPGTGVAAVATGSMHALVGLVGMIFGGIVYALSYPWIRDNILEVGNYGKQRLTDILPVSDALLYGILAIASILLFRLLEKGRKSSDC